MRGILFAGLLIALCGGAIMSDQAATGEDKKEKSPRVKADYDELVSYRFHTGNKDKPLTDPAKDIPAIRVEGDGKTTFYIIDNGKYRMGKNSEITDKNGVVFVVVDHSPTLSATLKDRFDYYRVNVKKKD